KEAWHLRSGPIHTKSMRKNNPSKLFELALVLVRPNHVASGILNASLRGSGHASKARMHHEQYDRSMKARETAMLVERAQRVMRESRKLLEQREAQLRQQEQFLEQHATIPHEMLRDTAIRATAL